MSDFTYKTNKHNISVFLGGRLVGYIITTRTGMYAYWPKGASVRDHGPSFRTIAEVKRSLEQDPSQ